MFSHQNNHHTDIADVNRVINNDQDRNIRVLLWNINGLGNKMTDPDLVAFIRNYDIIFFIETMKGNDFTLAIPLRKDGGRGGRVSPRSGNFQLY